MKEIGSELVAIVIRRFVRRIVKGSNIVFGGHCKKQRCEQQSGRGVISAVTLVARRGLITVGGLPLLDFML